jgi:hypothetical protein
VKKATKPSAAREAKITLVAMDMVLTELSAVTKLNPRHGRLCNARKIEFPMCAQSAHITDAIVFIGGRAVGVVHILPPVNVQTGDALQFARGNFEVNL